MKSEQKKKLFFSLSFSLKSLKCLFHKRSVVYTPSSITKLHSSSPFCGAENEIALEEEEEEDRSRLKKQNHVIVVEKQTTAPWEITSETFMRKSTCACRRNQSLIIQARKYSNFNRLLGFPSMNMCVECVF